MANTPAPHADAESAMDYAEHEATWHLFTGFVKWGIVAMVFLCLALYAFIEGHNALAGVVLLLLMVVAPIAGAVLDGRNKA